MPSVFKKSKKTGFELKLIIQESTLDRYFYGRDRKDVCLTYSWVSDFNLNRYFNEFCFRLNRSQSKETIFNNLITKMVNKEKVGVQYTLSSDQYEPAPILTLHQFRKHPFLPNIP